MKKRICAIFLSFIMIFSCFGLTAYAELPQINFLGVGDKVEFKWKNMSDINTIPNNAIFTLIFDTVKRTEDKYTVRICDNGIVISEQLVKIKPGKEIEKDLSINLKNGPHDLKISVIKNGVTKMEVSENVLVSEQYTHQFMDETIKKGANVKATTDMNFALSAYKLMGFNNVRTDTGKNWFWNETVRGVYNLEHFQDEMRAFTSNGIDVNLLSTYSTGVYQTEDGIDKSVYGVSATGDRLMPKTPESIQAYGRYTQAIIDKLYTATGATGFLQLYNEPNLANFSKSVVLPYENMDECAGNYADLLKATKTVLVKNGYDWVKIGAMELAAGLDNYAKLAMEYGAYYTFDAFGYHPYPEVNAFNAVHNMDKKVRYYEHQLTDAGGWKEVHYSETGFTTYAGGNTGEEFASINMPKMLAISDLNGIDNTTLYCLVDPSTDQTKREGGWGQFRYDLSPKPQVATITAFNNRTNGAKVVGDLNHGYYKDSHMVVYNKNGNPMICAWVEEGAGITLKLATPAQVFDMYGNLIDDNATEVELTKNPVYISTTEKTFFDEAAYMSAKTLNNSWLEKYPDEKQVAMPYFEKIYECLAETPNSEQVKNAIELYENLGIEITKLGKSGNLANIEVSKRLYDLYKPLRFVINLYASKLDNGGNITKTVYSEAELKAKNLYRNKMEIMQFSDAILKFAKKYDEESKLVATLEDNITKYGVIEADNLFVNVLCKWFDSFSEFEKPVNIGLLIQIPHYRKVIYKNNTIDLDMNLTNYSYDKFEGTIQCFDWNGEKIAETERFVLQANEQTITKRISFMVKKQDESSNYSRYTLKFVDKNGTVVAEQISDIKVLDKFNVSVKPVEAEPQNVEYLTLDVENLTDEEQNLRIKLTNDENLRFSSNEMSAVVEPNSVTTIKLPVAYIKDTDFHFYSYGYELYDANGRLCATDNLVVSFTSVPKTEKTIDIDSFDGSLDGWEDAYPVYINAPSNPQSKESWANADYSARVFTKWADDGLYILADVYDDAQLQGNKGERIWDGDCIQISIDPDNDGAKMSGTTPAYNSDDYEIGFSQTALGNEFYSWRSPNGLKSSVVDWFKFVRNDVEGWSRYLIKLDKNVLSEFDFAENKVFGLNFALNDADLLTRDNYAQFTLGTADQKNPSLYADFTLRPMR